MYVIRNYASGRIIRSCPRIARLTYFKLEINPTNTLLGRDAFCSNLIYNAPMSVIPPRYKQEAKMNGFNVRLTKTLLEMLDKMSAYYKINRSILVRDAISDFIEREYPETLKNSKD